MRRALKDNVAVVLRDVVFEMLESNSVRPTAPLAEIADGGSGLTPPQRYSTALPGPARASVQRSTVAERRPAFGDGRGSFLHLALRRMYYLVC